MRLRTMRAAVYPRYGGPHALEVRDVLVPTVGPEDILVKVCATTVNAAGRRLRSLSLPSGFGPFGRRACGLRRPRMSIPGSEFAGKVVAVGDRVRQFRAGERVFGSTGSRMGCHAQYVCVSAGSTVASIPAGVTYMQAAALPFGGATMLDFFARARLQAGERVLVNGATGAVGTAAVQLARIAGARVTAVCGAERAYIVRALGARPIVERVSPAMAAYGTQYDIIVDAAGTAPFATSGPLLAPGGRLLLVLASLGEMLRAPWNSFRSGLRVIAAPVSERVEHIHALRELASAGAFCPVLDRLFDFDDIRHAHEYVDAGHKLGSVVVQLN